MSSDPRDSSSDLDRARALSHRLRGQAPAVPGAPPTSEPRWADFSALRQELRGSRAPAPVSAPVITADFEATALFAPLGEAVAAPVKPAALVVREVPTLPTVAEVGSAAFDGLLEWCIAALGARDACIVDTQGLIVASQGGLSADSVQDVSARLVAAYAQVEQIDTAGLAPASLLVELPDAWLSGFRVTSGGGHSLYIALITPGALGREERVLVERAFASITRGL